MLDLSQLNAERLKNSYWETQLKKFDPALFIRFDEFKNRWMVFEYYPENISIKPLFWLEDNQGEPKEFGQWALNKLHVMRMNWEHKQRVGVSNWFSGLEKEADTQLQEMEEKHSEENKYCFKFDKLQMRKGVRELLNEPASDVFAGFQYNPPYKKRGEHAERETDFEQSEIRGAESPSVQPDSGKTTGSGQ